MKQDVRSRIIPVLLFFVLFVVVAVLGLTGCSSSNYGYTGGVAATVNGEDVDEDTITKYVQDFRTSSDLTDDSAWAEWMESASYDPETVRESVIDYYVEQALINQACEEYDVSIDDSEVQDQIDSMKANYDSDDAWQEALSQAGITEDEYREAIEQGLKEQALEDVIAGDVTATDEEVLEMFNSYSSIFENSRRSSQILFNSDDQELAQQVLDQINAGEISFEDAAAQYSQDTASAENGGDVGWDTLDTYVTEYQDALDSLEVGQVSDLVESDYGIHIIKCTDVFTPSENTTDLSTIPTDIVEYIREVVVSQNQSSIYQDWFSSYEDQADIEINDMPEDVPYNLDMSYYQSDDSSDDGIVESEEETTDTVEDE